MTLRLLAGLIYDTADARRFLRRLSQLQFRGRHLMVSANVWLPLMQTICPLYLRLVVTHCILAKS